MARLALRGERSSLRDLAYRRLREAIVHLEIAPSEKITEESLAEDLGVSRPVVREALLRLEAEGLVERAGNGRVRARAATVEDVGHLYAVRSALEQLAVEQASPRMTPECLAELGEALERMRAARGTTDPQQVTDGGGDFHRILARVADNPVNDQMTHLLRGRIDRYRRLSVTEHARPPQSVAEHEQILDALSRGDVDAAKQAMHQHIVAGRDAVLAALERVAAPAESA